MENFLLGNSKSGEPKGKAYSWKAQCQGGCSFKERQGHSFRMVNTPSCVPPDLPEVAYPSCGSICHCPKSQVADLCVSHARSKGLGGRCTEHSMAQSSGICLPSCGNFASSGPEDAHLPMQANSDSPRVARDAVVLGPVRAVSVPTTQTAPLVKTAQSHQEPYHTHLELLSLHAWLLDSNTGSHLGSPPRWRRELELLRDHLPGQSMSQSGPFMGHGASRTKWTSSHHLLLK